MAAELRWLPLGPGPSTGIDWSRLERMRRTDPYLCWWDLRGRLQRLAPEQAVPLLLELAEGVTTARAVQRLAAIGLAVPAVYRRAGARATRFLTASARDARSLAALQAELDRDGGVLTRFEASAAAIDCGAARASAPHGAEAAQGLRELVGFIDFGCAFAHRRFREPDGRTRIRALWNQQVEAPERPPAPYRPARWHAPPPLGYGRQLLDRDIDDYVAAFTRRGRVDEERCYRWAGYAAVRRHVAHGTHVMDVAAGSRPKAAGYARATPAPALAFVQLPQAPADRPTTGLLKPHVLDGLRYLESLLGDDARAVFNLSYGGHGGPHDGSSILERAMDELVQRHRCGGEPRVQIVIAAGNALGRALHAQLPLAAGGSERLHWNTLPDDRTDSFAELWLPPGAEVELTVTPPAGPPSPPLRLGEGGACRDPQGRVVAAVVAARRVCQGEDGTMLLVASAPTAGRAGARAGRWSLGLRNLGAYALTVDAWCERDEPPFGSEGDPQQAFFSSHVVRTGSCNAIGHGRETLVVGALDLQHEPGRGPGAPASGPGGPAPYSGTGPGRGLPGRLRQAPQPGMPPRNAPDLLARAGDGGGQPGVAGAAVLGEDAVRLEGTSVAAAWATRWIVEHDFASPPRWRAGADLLPAPVAQDEHPDRLLDLPRLP